MSTEQNGSHSAGPQRPNGLGRPNSFYDAEANYIGVPSNDNYLWYYPSHGYDSDEGDLRTSTPEGNWGRKMAKGARWVRRGKMIAWGPGIEEWETEERARKRIKVLLAAEPPSRSPSPPTPTLPHLREPSPPPSPPFPSPTSNHLSYTSFVMDKGITHSFRSRLLDDLEQATQGLIEGEGTLRRALGRLWQAMSEDPDKRGAAAKGKERERNENGYGDDDALQNGDENMEVDNAAPLVPKREEEIDLTADPNSGEDHDLSAAERSNPLNEVPPTHKIFLSRPPVGPEVSHPLTGSPSHFAPNHNNPLDPTNPTTNGTSTPPAAEQEEQLKRAMASLRELMDDGREYCERLEEIRGGIGEVRRQREGVWELVRRKAVSELKDAAVAAAG